MKNFDNKTRGNIGVGAAIAFASSKGWSVSVPLTDTQRYDVVFDIDGKLCRVQVKTTVSKSKEGSWVVQLKNTSIRKTSPTKIKLFNAADVEYLFILTGEGDRFFIPSSEVIAKNGLTISGRIEPYRVCDFWEKDCTASARQTGLNPVAPEREDC